MNDPPPNDDEGALLDTGSIFGPEGDPASASDRAADATLVPQLVAKLEGYELVRKLGQGAMGLVFLARQLAMDRPVAIKVLMPYYAEHDDAVERFQREMRLLGRCSHPNIVAGYDAGFFEGLYYYVMEYVEGWPLDVILRREQRLPFGQALDIVRGTAEAVAHAHEMGLVHRDIKPANIIVAPDDTPKLLDLGLAKIIDDGAGDGEMTRAGLALGTPPYMAPEQLAGTGELDTRVDIYALGITFHELLAGSVPYPGRGLDHLTEDKLHGRFPEEELRRRGIGEDTIAVIRRMCAPALADRHPDPQALLADLDRIARGESVEVPAGQAREPENRVLLVEDNPATAFVVQKLLEDEGHRVEVILDGTEALAAVREVRPPRLVLLDVELPDADGYEILEALRDSPIWREVPVIMLSGRDAEEDIVRSLDAGADDHVAKPPRPAELLARVRRQLAKA